MNKDRIEYQFSLPIYLLGLSLILILGFILSITTYILNIKDFYIAIIVFIWLLYGLIFRDAIPRIIRTGNNILVNRPALVLTNQKLIDNINNQQLEWKDILEIEEYHDTQTGSYIAIKVKNPEQFITKKKSYFDRLIMKFNQKYWNGIFAIRPMQVKCKKQELLENLKSYINKDKNN